MCAYMSVCPSEEMLPFYSQLVYLGPEVFQVLEFSRFLEYYLCAS